MVKMWRPLLETQSRKAYEKRQLRLFKRQMQYLMDRSPFYRRKFAEAKVTPRDIRKLEDVRRVPFTTKQELLQSQEEHPPFGDFPCIPPEAATRVFQTSGTTGIPLKVPYNKRDWFKNCFEQFSYYVCGYGIDHRDVAFFPFMYGLFIAWWGLQAAFEQHEVTIVPGGGQSSETRLRSLVDWNATVVCGTPTYIIFLGELAPKIGIDLPRSKVRVVVTAGEPGAQVPATKKRIEELWGAKNYDDIGSTEITNFGFECLAQQGTHLNEIMFLPELLDIKTGAPVPPGQVGELVLSNLCCESAPLLRYLLRLEGGVLGRADDMFYFGGVNIFPSAIENFIRRVPEFSTEYQLLVPAQGSGKRLRIRVEKAAESIPDERMQTAIKGFTKDIVYHIKVTPEVEVAAPGSLQRFEGKARRLIRET
ncbi:MAG: AMP-binding protein [Desulfobacterota bacterium]|nr:AMP-binding protein [Thermodesulfobacteriota bacterium]